MADESVSKLPKHILRRIDRAFDKTLRQAGISPRKEPEVVEEPSSSTGAGRRRSARIASSSKKPSYAEPGGFLLDNEPGGFLRDDDPPESQPGGFLPAGQNSEDEEGDGTTYQPSTSDLLPLSHIPSALQILDLPPHDPEVLEVFENAASGWGGGGHAGSDENQSVSRKDFRAVCSVLMDVGDHDDEQMVDEEEDENDEDDGFEEDDDGGSDQLEADEGDEYSPQKPPGRSKQKAKPVPPKTRKRKRKARDSSLSGPSSDDDDGPKPLTERQKRDCREAFALFFPDVPEDELENQKLRIKELSQAAKLIRWKLTADEIIAMLEAFSSTNDKTMSLADFERMMVATKLT